jgi:hypothetical protein
MAVAWQYTFIVRRSDEAEIETFGPGWEPFDVHWTTGGYERYISFRRLVEVPDGEEGGTT